MKNKSLVYAALMSAALVMTSPASAGSYSFDFLASDGTYQVTGTFGTAETLNVAGGYDILSITGSVTGAIGGSITSLVANPNQPGATTNYGFIFDNNLFASNQRLNSNGVLFETAGNTKWNLWGNSPTQYELNSYAGVDKLGTMTVAAVPEPETYAMMLAGLGMLGFLARRRKQNAAA